MTDQNRDTGPARGYGDSASQGAQAQAKQEGASGQGSLDRTVEDSIGGSQGSDADQQSAYRAGSEQGGAAPGGQTMTSETGGYGGGGFDQADAGSRSGQVGSAEGRSFDQGRSAQPQRGENEEPDHFMGPDGDPAEGSRDVGATGRGPLDSSPA